MHQTLTYRDADGVATVVLDRPDKLNALNQRMVDELHEVVTDVRRRGHRVLLFSGAGRMFCAGADLAELTTLDSPTTFLRYLDAIQGVFDDIERLPCATIAAIHGGAYGGGCELAIACDFRVMAADAKIGVPEVKLGVLPGAGGTQRLPRLLPPALAKEMLVLGDPIDAERALRFGLVNRVVPRAELESAANELARRVLAMAPLAVAAAKQLARAAGEADLTSGLDAERRAVAFLFGTEDGREGIRAFVEKRGAKFVGR
jgi:enoyl-CoA hydratase